MDIANKILYFIKGKAQKAGTIFNRNTEGFYMPTLTKTTNGLQEKLMLLGFIKSGSLIISEAKGQPQNELLARNVVGSLPEEIQTSPCRKFASGQQATENKPLA